MEGENKYADGKIYKLVAPGTLDCYIGSTCGKLQQRLWHHTHAYNNKGTQTQCSSYKLYDFCKDVSIQLVEVFPCASKAELEVRERYWIEQTPTSLNKNLPGQSWQERWEKNREHNIAKHKEWIAANHEKIAAQRAAYAPIQKEKGKLREALPENRAKRNAAKKVIATCELCQKEMNKNSLWEHKKRVHTPGANPLQNIST
jgi:hypothetical protein